MITNNAILITQLIALADFAKQRTTPEIYASQVRLATELITAVIADQKISPLRAMIAISKEIKPGDTTTRIWLAAAVVEMVEMTE